MQDKKQDPSHTTKDRSLRITSKGQVTIPAHIREHTGLLPHTEVEIFAEGNSVRVVPAEGRRQTGRGTELIAQLRQRGDVTMSTDEIMALTRGES